MKQNSTLHSTDCLLLPQNSGLPRYQQLVPSACEACDKPLNTAELFNSSKSVCQRSNCTYSSLQQHVQAIVA